MKKYLLLSLILLLLIPACSTLQVQIEQPAAPDALESAIEPEHEAGAIAQVEELIIAMLFISVIVSLITRRLRIPYTVGLVLVGLGLTFLGPIPVLDVTPELILALLVPPLIFEAAFHLNFAELRRELKLVLLLAIPGVILTTFLVGGLVSLGAGIHLTTALVFGALIAATDPVAVIALFRTLGMPRRLQTLLEGESLLNDGTAIVIFNLMLAVALTGRMDLGQTAVEFVTVAGGGLLVGAAAGLLISQIIGRIDDYLVETALTTVLAYGSYLIAEYVVGVSGVLAVVAAGLATGQIGPRGMSPTTRIVVFNFWEFAAFLANSFIFLIIGLETDLQILIDNAAAIGWAIAAVLIARAVTVYGLSALRRDIPVQWKNILFWGGLRGAIPLALALSLAVDFPYRVQIQAMAFGVVLFTLIVEGLTMQRLVKRSNVTHTSAAQLEFECNQARAAALRAAQARIQQLHLHGSISAYARQQIMPVLEQQLDRVTQQTHDALEAEPDLRMEELTDAWREGLRAQRSALTSLYRDNIISEDTYSALVAEVDFALENPESNWPKPQPDTEDLETET